MTVPVIETVLFDKDGATRIRPLKKRAGLRVMEEFNGPGFGSITVPSTQASVIVRDQVIKVSYDGTIVGAFIVEKYGRIHADADGKRWVTLSGRGLLAWVHDMVVYPQAGFASYNPTDRPFNFAGVGGGFYSRVTWTQPVGFKWSAAGSSDYRYRQPKGWPDPNAYWIWRTDPTAAVAAGTTNYFRTTFTTSTLRKLKFYATADNFFRLYIDGALVLQTSDLQGEGATWKKIASRVMTIAAGTHTLAAIVTNGATGSVSNKAGFLCTVTNLTATGKPSTVIRHTTPTSTWYVTATEPKWYPAEIVDQLVDEGIARGITRLSYFTTGWGSTTDSSSRAWSTAIAKQVRVGTKGLDLISQMVDHGVDFWMDPATNTLQAYETRGTDKSLSVLLKVGKNLTAYETSSDSIPATAALVRSADGWTQATNTAGVTAIGRRETFIEVGDTRSEATASAVASRVLARMAKYDVTVERCTTVPTTSTRPFLDYAPGDRVTAYSSTGTKSSARVLSIALAEDADGLVTADHELEVLA